MLYLVEWFDLINFTTCDPIQRFIKQQEYNPISSHCFCHCFGYFEHNKGCCTIVKVLYVPAYEISDIAFFVGIADSKYLFPQRYETCFQLW